MGCIKLELLDKNFYKEKPPLRDHYFLKDHLGNIRVTFKDNNGVAEVVSAKDYYPFGSVMRSMQAIPDEQDKMGYQSKELDSETGLHYFEARMYDKDIGRFYNVDAYAEKYVGINPYHYTHNNPMNGIEINGEETWFINGFNSDRSAFNDDGFIASAMRISGNQRRRFKDPYGLGMYDSGWSVNSPNRSYGLRERMFGATSELLEGLFKSAPSRYEMGKSFAEKWLTNRGGTIKDGKLDGETMSFFTHSSGAAFAEGMAAYFQSQGINTENMFHFSPYNGGDLETSTLAKVKNRVSYVSGREFGPGVFKAISGVKGSTKIFDFTGATHTGTVSTKTLEMMQKVSKMKISKGPHQSLADK